ncbi:MAG: molybdopterin cofactor-binding domain-containing protein [Pseudomonadota bacterium]
MNRQAPFPSAVFHLDGTSVEAFPAPGARLSEVLREDLGRRDVKIGCNAGDCGACTVLVDGAPVCACLMPAHQAAGRQVETLAGLYRQDTVTQALAAQFEAHGAAQCGICTPGMMVSATALLRADPAPSEDAVCDALAGVLCRCTGYRKIIEAVMGAPRPDAPPTGAAQTDAPSIGAPATGAPPTDAPPTGAMHTSATQTGTTQPSAMETGATQPSAMETGATVSDRALLNTASPGTGAPTAAPPGGPLAEGIGAACPRLDGRDKVAGREAFGDDVAPPGTLELLVIRTPHARAMFTFGDLDAFVAATEGVAAVLTAADIPGDNLHGVIPDFVDQPVFATGETRFRGEAVAAVVATRAALSGFDPTDFPVTWTPLPPASDPETAMAPDTPPLHPDRAGNVMCRGFVARGDIDAGLAAGDVSVTGRFATGFVEHAYIEPEAGFARMAGDRVEVFAATQAPVMDLDGLARILGLPRDRIRVVPTGIGGGFGSKLDLSVQPYLALAALKTGAPVRLAYSRGESMQSTTKRHPATITMTVAARADGTLTGIAFDGTFDTGAYASWGPTVANRVPVHASGPYAVPHYRARSTAVHTNNPPSGAFRGFGVPQSAIAQESLFDALAEKLALDPLEFRIQNALTAGQPTVCGQVFAQGVGIRTCLERLRPAWAEARAAAAAFNREGGVLRRGVGVAAGWYGCGNTSMPNPSTIKAGLRADGTVVLHQGAVDLGQGSNTVISQIFAAALGLPLSAITRVGADTDVTPDAGKTSASRQTFVSGNAADRTGRALRREILERLNVDPDAALTLAPGQVTARDGAGAHRLDLSVLPQDAEGYVLCAEESYDPPTLPLDANGQGSPYAQFGYAAHMAIVEVDTGLGTVRPLRFVAAHDVGRAINPLLVEGQIHGGIAQGLGMALMEEYIPGRTENLHDYLIPTIGDMPPVEAIIVEAPDAHGPHGAKGLGEHVLIPTAPALLNAINHATGARISRVPATPARVRAAITALTP